jgi:hypothetical protein
MQNERMFLERLRLPLIAAVAAGTLALTACGLTGEHPNVAVPPSISQDTAPVLEGNAPHSGMSKAEDPQLQLLAGYESALNHRFSDEMLFTNMPRTQEEGKAQAADLAGKLKEYGKYGVKPLIIMEPMAVDGGKMDLKSLSSHESVSALDALFSGLKDEGITDKQMGTLVPLPEADLPDWGGHTTDPALFGKNYAAVGTAFKKAFPKAHLSLLLDSAAYPNGDVDYANGDTSAAALMPYVKALKDTPGMPAIDSIGFQGFPWNTTDKPTNYLDHSVATALAKELDVHSIWFNTGTAESYSNKKVPTQVRRDQLLGELAQAGAAKAEGFDVRMNLFAFEDPNVQWKYSISTHGDVAAPLPEFMKAAQKSGIDTELFVTK